MTGEYSGDLVLMDFIPAGTGRGVIDVHKAGMEIASECVAFIEDQGHAVIAVTGRVEDFAV